MWKRLKNIWHLGEYDIRSSPEILDQRVRVLVKDIVTVKKQLAKVVNIPEEPFFEEVKTDA